MNNKVLLLDRPTADSSLDHWRQRFDQLSALVYWKTSTPSTERATAWLLLAAILNDSSRIAAIAAHFRSAAGSIQKRLIDVQKQKPTSSYESLLFCRLAVQLYPASCSVHTGGLFNLAIDAIRDSSMRIEAADLLAALNRPNYVDSIIHTLMTQLAGEIDAELMVAPMDERDMLSSLTVPAPTPDQRTDTIRILFVCFDRWLAMITTTSGVQFPIADWLRMLQAALVKDTTFPVDCLLLIHAAAVRSVPMVASIIGSQLLPHCRQLVRLLVDHFLWTQNHSDDGTIDVLIQLADRYRIGSGIHMHIDRLMQLLQFESQTMTTVITTASSNKRKAKKRKLHQQSIIEPTITTTSDNHRLCAILRLVRAIIDTSGCMLKVDTLVQCQRRICLLTVEYMQRYENGNWLLIESMLDAIISCVLVGHAAIPVPLQIAINVLTMFTTHKSDGVRNRAHHGLAICTSISRPRLPAYPTLSASWTIADHEVLSESIGTTAVDQVVVVEKATLPAVIDIPAPIIIDNNKKKVISRPIVKNIDNLATDPDAISVNDMLNDFFDC